VMKKLEDYIDISRIKEGSPYLEPKQIEFVTYQCKEILKRTCEKIKEHGLFNENGYPTIEGIVNLLGDCLVALEVINLRLSLQDEEIYKLRQEIEKQISLIANNI
jgi:hypothetical protein